jgi:2,3-bisphosphoglycerate-independent phosphoglycerate mutase
MQTKHIPKFIVLTILDGWGIANDGPGNAITKANTPNMDKFMASYPHTLRDASGEAVGLPRGEDGNTETGHLNLGAGKIVYQDLERINMSIADGSFFENKVLLGAIKHVKENNSDLHLMGLVGAGGVHSNIEHLYALINLAHRNNIKNVYVHIFTDGRDSPPTAAKTYINNIAKVMKKEGTGEIASIMGRYWAMDRDQRWDRTEKAYMALTQGKGNLVSSVDEAIDSSYSEGKTDEFIEPALVAKNGKPIALINDNDSVIFFNFRIDRPRQLTKVFVLKDFSKAHLMLEFDPFQVMYKKTHITKVKKPAKQKPPFDRGEKLKNLYFVTMTEYGKSLTEDGAKPAFPPEEIENPLSRVVSDSGLRQLKITESEKERFVTFYINGLREEAFPLEERIIIPSPPVPTYDQAPKMSAEKITETLLNKLQTLDYQLVIVNYPNADMVGHTGNIGPTVKACEEVDKCLGRLADFVIAYNGALLITGDHGNAEEMINAQTGEIDTEHSTNPVPFIAISQNYLGKSQVLQKGILADIAPTILSLFGITVPSTMTGRNLLSEVH